MKPNCLLLSACRLLRRDGHGQAVDSSANKCYYPVIIHDIRNSRYILYNELFHNGSVEK